MCQFWFVFLNASSFLSLEPKNQIEIVHIIFIFFKNIKSHKSQVN